MWCSSCPRRKTERCSTVQYSTVQYRAVQCSTVQYSTVQCSAVRYSAVQCSTVRYDLVQGDSLHCELLLFLDRSNYRNSVPFWVNCCDVLHRTPLPLPICLSLDVLLSTFSFNYFYSFSSPLQSLFPSYSKLPLFSSLHFPATDESHWTSKAAPGAPGPQGTGSSELLGEVTGADVIIIDDIVGE